LAKFGAMSGRQSFKRCGPGPAKLHKDIPPVLRAILPFDQVLGTKAINQLDARMMSDLELPGQFPDSHLLPPGKSLDREQSLMLARSQTGNMGRVFTELQKLSKVIAKCRQPLVFGFCETWPTLS